MKYLGLVYAISAAVTWGVVYTIDQKILGKTSPLSLLFLNSLISLVIMLPFFLANSGSMKLFFNSGRFNILLVVLSILLALLANFFIFSSIKILGASTASVFEIAYPFFVVLFSYIIFKATINWYFALGSLLMFAGALIIIKLS